MNRLNISSLKKFIGPKPTIIAAGIILLISILVSAYLPEGPRLVVNKPSEPQLVCVVFADSEPAAFAQIMLFSDHEFVWMRPEDTQSESPQIAKSPNETFALEDLKGVEPAYLDGRVPVYNAISKEEGLRLLFSDGEPNRTLIQMGESGCARLTGLKGRYEVFSPNYFDDDYSLEKGKRSDLRMGVQKVTDRVTLTLPAHIRSLRLELGEEQAKVWITDAYTIGVDNECFIRGGYHIYNYTIYKHGLGEKRVRIPAPCLAADGLPPQTWPYQVSLSNDRHLSILETTQNKSAKAYVEQRLPNDPVVVRFPEPSQSEANKDPLN